MSNSSSNSSSDSSVITTSGTQDTNQGSGLSQIVVQPFAVPQLDESAGLPARLPVPEEHRYRGNGGGITQLVIGVIWPFLPQLPLGNDRDEAVFGCAIIIASLIYSRT